MPRLIVPSEVEDDLDVLVESHPDDVGLIDALLEELRNDQEALSALDRDVPKTLYMLEPPFEIKKFEECWSLGLRIYSLKPFDEDGHRIDFRVFLGHNVVTDDWFVLSIQPRATCYDTSTNEFRILCSRYSGLRIPSYRV